MNVVVVESPAKAKTINKYLGPGFTVLASYGHVRDLPSKDGSVRPDEDFAMSWDVDPKALSEAAAELGSEVRYREPVFTPKDLVIAISQSGETADTLAALKSARS